VKKVSNIIGRLCLDAHPEAQNEIEAMDIHIQELYKRIQLKLNARIPAADDIEFYFALLSTKTDLEKITTISLLKREDDVII